MKNIEVLDAATLTDFLTKASQRHLGGDWVDRYAEDAHRLHQLDPDMFARRLRAAAAAHAAYERRERNGKPDADWARWQAEHMLATQSEKAPG